MALTDQEIQRIHDKLKEWNTKNLGEYLTDNAGKQYRLIFKADHTTEAVAVAPVVNGEVDYKQVAIVVAGTQPPKPFNGQFYEEASSIRAVLAHFGLSLQYDDMVRFYEYTISQARLYDSEARVSNMSGFSQAGPPVAIVAAEHNIERVTNFMDFGSISLLKSGKIPREYLDYFKRHLFVYTESTKDFTAFDRHGGQIPYGNIYIVEGGSNLFTDHATGDSILAIKDNGLDIEEYVKRGQFATGMNDKQIRQVAEKKAKDYRESGTISKFLATFNIGEGVTPRHFDLSDPEDYVRLYRRNFDPTIAEGTEDKIGLFVKGLSWGENMLGTDKSDVLSGQDGDDNIKGGKGRDFLYGDNGKDILNGESGSDELYGGKDDDSLSGGDGHDKMQGNGGNDNLNGDKGNDYHDGGTGDDWLYDGDGDDTFIYKEGYGDDVIYDDKGDNHVRLTDLNAKHIEGTITKHGEAALRVKSDGGHLIFRNFRSDKNFRNFTLEYGDGTQLHLEKDKDTPFRKLVGTDDKDNFRAFLDDTTIHGKAGDDELSSDKKNTTLYGEEGNDKLEVRGEGKNRLYGGAGDDKLQASKGENLLDGGDGKDELSGSQGNDVLLGGLGNDYLRGGSGNDTHDGGQGDDRMEDWKGNDTYLYGLDTGNDYVSDSEGKNTIKIAPELDLTDLYVRQVDMWDGELRNQKSNSIMTISGLHHYHDKRWERFQLEFADGRIIDGTAENSPLRRVLGSSGDDDMTTVITTGTNYISAYEGNDNIWTSKSDDTVDAGSGDDTIKTYGGHDTLIGGLGNDTMKGGDGNDTYVIDEQAGTDYIDDEKGDNTIQVSVNILPEEVYARTYNGKGYFSLFVTKSASETKIVKHTDAWKNFSLKLADGTIIDNTSERSPFRRIIGTDEGEYLSHITSIGDTLFGLDGNDQLSAGAGNDYLYGGADNDRLYGYGGNDFLDGGLGDDYLEGGDGENTYVYSANGGKDHVPYSSHGTIHLASDLRFGDVYISGTASYYTVILKNHKGDGEIHLGRFYDNFGNNQKVWETIKVSQSDGTVISASDPLSPFRRYRGNDKDNYYQAVLPVDSQLEGLAGDDELTGNIGNDTLLGGDGKDYLRGLEGNDTFVGGKGRDSLFGENGDDTYVLTEDGEQDFISDLKGDNIVKVNFVAKISDFFVRNSREWMRGADAILTNVKNTATFYFSDFARNNHWQHYTMLFQDGQRMRVTDSDSPFRQVKGTEERDEVSAVLPLDSRLEGFAGNDTLYGLEGHDTLDGGDGDDHLHGNKGDDIFIGGLGDDHLMGEEGNDSYHYSSDMGRDKVFDKQGHNRIQLSSGLQLSDLYVRYSNWDVELFNTKTHSSLTIGNFYHQDTQKAFQVETADGQRIDVLAENSPFRLVRGSDQADSLYSYLPAGITFRSLGGDDHVSGTVYDDTIYGDAGRDRLNGQGGNDYIDGGQEQDELYGGAGDGGGEGQDRLKGEHGDDALSGGAGQDQLEGNDGDDRLDGGRDNDNLQGGQGNDSYVFNQGDGQDRVYDNLGQNVLHFGKNIIPEQLKLTKTSSDLMIDYHESDRVTLSSYFYNSSFRNISLAFANKQTATINAESLTLNITPAPTEEKVEEVPVSETVLTPDVTATQVTPTETVKTETVTPAEGEVAVQSVTVGTSNMTDEAASAVAEVEDVIKSSEDVLATYPTINTGETMAYIAQPLPNVTNQVVGQ